MARTPLLYAILSAALFGISTPMAKLLIVDISPVALAGLLYLGAFLGLSVFVAFRAILLPKGMPRAPLDRKDAPWLAGAIVIGGVVAPIALMTGLASTSGLAASLLTNIEGVMTAAVAVIAFKEFAGRRLWLALLLMTIAGIILSWNPSQEGLSLVGPLLIILAMLCWGIDNNFTRQISEKDPVRIAGLKGLIAGATSISLALLLGLDIPLGPSIFFALVLGAISYGLSLVLFIKALEGLGSARTGTFFSLAPFIGAAASVIVLGDAIAWPLALAAVLMLLGVWLVAAERHIHQHRHERETHSHLHEAETHHAHAHPEGELGPHVHEHTHEEMVHSHVHWPDHQNRHQH